MNDFCMIPEKKDSVSVLVKVYVTLVSLLFHVIVAEVELLQVCIRLKGAVGGSEYGGG